MRGLGAAELAAWCWTFGALIMALRFMRQCHGVRRLQTTLVAQPDADASAEARESFISQCTRQSLQVWRQRTHFERD